MDWESLNTLDEFKDWVGSQASPNFTFKVGVFNGHEEKFDGIGHFFHSFFPQPPTSKTDPAVDTPLGKLTYQTLILEPAVLFEAIGESGRQGDFLVHQPDVFGSEGLQPSYWIVLSHSCDIENKPFISLAPGFTFPLLTKLTKQLGIKPASLAAISENKTIRFLSLPPPDLLEDELVIFDLSLGRPFPSDLIKRNRGVISLSLAGTYYLQNRLGVLFLRDVRDTDDARSLRGNV